MATRKIGRWIAMVGIVTACPGMAQERVTTLPRPAQYSANAEPLPAPTNNGSAQSLLASPPVVETVPQLPPVGAAPASVPFYRRFRAELVEAAVLFPIVHQSRNALVPVSGGIGDVDVRLPTASLGVTAPVILNFQFDASRYGELNFSYKLLAAEGNRLVFGLDPEGLAVLRSRLDMNVVDLTFASAGYRPLWNMLWFDHRDPIKPLWGMRWDLGARVATLFHDSRLTGPTLTRQVSSFFVGGGPHVGLTIHRVLGETGLEAFLHTDFGSNLGTVNQQFSELVTDGLGNPLGYGYVHRQDFRWVPTLRSEAGVGGPGLITSRGEWRLAYQFEQWWGVGSVGSASPADLVTHGAVLRWRLRY